MRGVPDAQLALFPPPVSRGIAATRPAIEELVGRADLHVHSYWSDGAQSPQALVKRASGRLHVLAITDHDEIRGALVARQFARARPELGVEVVIGEEISTRNGHLLGLFLEERIPPGLTALATIERIHAQGGLAVVAHPCHPMNVRDRGARCLTHLIGDLPLDGIEAVNNAGFFSWLYDAIAALRNLEWALPVTGGSDAHDVWYVGSGLTRFEGRRPEDLRRALLAARTRAQVRWRWTADKMPRHVAIQMRSLVRFTAILARREPQPRLWRVLGAIAIALSSRREALAPRMSAIRPETS